MALDLNLIGSMEYIVGCGVLDVSGVQDEGMRLSDGVSGRGGMGLADAMGAYASPGAFPIHTRFGTGFGDGNSDTTSQDTFLTALDYEQGVQWDTMSMESFRTRAEDIEHVPELLNDLYSGLQSIVTDEGAEGIRSHIPECSASSNGPENDGGGEKVLIKDGVHSRYVPKSTFYRWTQTQPATEYNAAKDPYATPPLLHRSPDGTETFDMEDRKRSYPRVVAEPRRLPVGKPAKKTVRFAETVQYFEHDTPGTKRYRRRQEGKRLEDFVIRYEMECEDEWTDGSETDNAVDKAERKRDVVKKAMERVFKRILTCFGNAPAVKKYEREYEAGVDVEGLV